MFRIAGIAFWVTEDLAWLEAAAAYGLDVH
jgi:hypothetical protein